MNNEEIFGIVAALLFFSLCFVCCADWCGECSSEIDFINNQINEDTNEDTDIESNTTEKKVVTDPPWNREERQKKQILTQAEEIAKQTNRVAELMSKSNNE